MKFRLQRGGLDESMQTVVEIEPTKQAIANHYNYVLNGNVPMILRLKPYLPQDFDVKPYGYDKRIGWDTYIVTTSDGVVGFTDAAVQD
jgi:hypothetical protein